MDQIDEIAERIRLAFDSRTAARDRALAQARTLTRYCANGIRAVHRGEHDLARQALSEAGGLAESLRNDLAEFPDLYYAGYTQDALKEYAEANIVFALVNDLPLPSPEELQLEAATYLQGLAEAVGELRRSILDVLRDGHSQDAERMLTQMDDIYTMLVTMDYPEAITGGLRRLTDIVRSITERTRGDVMLSLRQQMLEEKIGRVEILLNEQHLG